MFVLDCSVTMAWLFEDEKTPLSDKIFDLLEEEQAIVPALWILEVLNVLLCAEKKKRINSSHSAHFLNVLSNLPIQIVENNSINQCASILALARMYDLTSYDATYLDLASRLGLPLATLDKNLIKGAKMMGVNILS